MTAGPRLKGEGTVTMPSPSQRTAAEGESAKVDFYFALRAMQTEGVRYRRATWPAGEHVFMHAGFLHIRLVTGNLHVLQLSDGDIAGRDWERVL